MDIKNTLKEYIKLVYVCPDYNNVFRKLKTKKKKIVLFGTPAHGNLGDHAIALSELAFLKNIASNETIIEVPMPMLKVFKNKIKKFINSEDVILISGGGWMGSVWVDNEMIIREIVLDYLENKIVILPQTIYYEDNEISKKLLEDGCEIYKKHRNLYIFVRENNSYEAAIKLLGVNNGHIMFCPDMALYGNLELDMKCIEGVNDGKLALVCFREDIEKKYDTEGVVTILEESGILVKRISTVDKRFIKMKDRDTEIHEMLKELAKADFLVTDRLHAMILSLLAGTPCYVFDNSTKKVFGVAEYLKDNGFQVELIYDIEQFKKLEYKSMKKTFIKTDYFNKCYDNLANVILNDVAL